MKWLTRLAEGFTKIERAFFFKQQTFLPLVGKALVVTDNINDGSVQVLTVSPLASSE